MAHVSPQLNIKEGLQASSVPLQFATKKLGNCALPGLFGGRPGLRERPEGSGQTRAPFCFAPEPVRTLRKVFGSFQGLPTEVR